MVESESSSNAMSSLWSRSKGKLSGTSSSKNNSKVKFMPLVGEQGSSTSGIAKEAVKSSAEAAQAAKQHRRAQVRKAQIEHRERKANYTKHLEQDIINLRGQISAAEAEAEAVQNENEAIRNALLNMSISPSSDDMLMQSQDPFLDSYACQLPQTSKGQLLQPMQTQLSALVSIGYDEIVDQNCLQISPFDGPLGFGTQDDFGMMNSGFAATQISSLESSKNKDLPPIPTEHRLEQKQRQTRTTPKTKTSTSEDISTIAINFILALEHPCRTHFQSPHQPFDPKAPSSNHELMASTLLFATAPPSVFPTKSSKSKKSKYQQTQTQWASSSPQPTLATLRAMADSLPKDDWEITPVQAWFLLVDKIGVSYLLEEGTGGGGGRERLLDKLKRGLGGVMKCFEFGAVVEEGLFWEVIGAVVGAEEASRLRWGG